MKKLGRFSLLAFFYLLLTIGFYSVIPAVSWLFGGEFLAVAQHPVHVLFVGTIVAVMVGVVFNESFDKNFYSKD